VNSAPSSPLLEFIRDGGKERYRLVWAGRPVSVISPSFLVLDPNKKGGSKAAFFLSYAEHVRQLGGESPLHNLVEVK